MSIRGHPYRRVYAEALSDRLAEPRRHIQVAAAHESLCQGSTTYDRDGH